MSGGHGGVGVKDGEDHSLENIIVGSNDVRLRDIRRKSAEQMVDFLGEAMMKKQESNLGLVFCIFR